MGIEGSFILANEYENYLLKEGVKPDSIRSVKKYINKLSVLPESRIARKNGVKALHDVTEGGVYGAVAEMAAASNLGYLIEKDNFNISSEVADICNKLNMDPAGLISSGTMLMAAPEEINLKEIFKNNDINISRVGKLLKSGQYIIENGEKKVFEPPTKDELWKFIEKNI
jgi:hydrogenase maturation factor